jgi:hypothetical protein
MVIAYLLDAKLDLAEWHKAPQTGPGFGIAEYRCGRSWQNYRRDRRRGKSVRGELSVQETCLCAKLSSSEKLLCGPTCTPRRLTPHSAKPYQLPSCCDTCRSWSTLLRRLTMLLFASVLGFLGPVDLVCLRMTPFFCRFFPWVFLARSRDSNLKKTRTRLAACPEPTKKRTTYRSR